MHRKAGIQQTILSAAFALLLTNLAYAATEVIDSAGNPSTPLANDPVIEPFDPNKQPKVHIPIAEVPVNDPVIEPFDPNKEPKAPLPTEDVPVNDSVIEPFDPNKEPKAQIPIEEVPVITPEYVPVIESFDPNKPPRAHIPIGPNLLFGGFVSLRADSNRNYSLNTQPNDADSIFKPELSLAFAYDPNRYIHVYANPRVEKPVAFEETVDRTQDLSLRLNQAYLALNNVVDGTALQIGRQRFRDVRRWLFDENLDAAKLTYSYQDLSMEFSASRFLMVQRELLRREPTDSQERFINYYYNISYKLSKQSRVGVFAIYQDDRLFDKKHPWFFGLQSEGEIVRHLDYWIQAAIVRGTDGSKRIRGEAVDVGLTKVFGGALKPSITVGYAYGTGDDNPDDNVDTAFRQTGFQGNSDSFNGVARFKYYGEVLDPRLENLMIFTGGVGIRPSDKTSFDLVYHYYSQDHASTRIHGSDLNIDPTGLSKHVGSELDFVAGYHEISQLYTRFILGYFVPGRAFAETSSGGAFTASLLLRYTF